MSAVQTQLSLKKLVDFLSTQPETAHLTEEQVTADATREELGIGSLAVILLVNNYIQANAPGVMIDPAWVPRLNDGAGIISVLDEIDQSAS